MHAGAAGPVKSAARVRDTVAPTWLIEAVRPRAAPVPAGLQLLVYTAFGTGPLDQGV